MVWGHFLAPKDWSCKSDINLRPNFDREIAVKRMQKKIFKKKCKILPTIRSAAVALRCKTCSIFISVTEFREFCILQLFLLQDFKQSLPSFQTGGKRWIILVVHKYDKVCIEIDPSDIGLKRKWGKTLCGFFLNFAEILSRANLLKREMQAASCSEKTNKHSKRHSAYAHCTMHIHNNQTHRLGLFKSNTGKERYKLFLIWRWSQSGKTLKKMVLLGASVKQQRFTPPTFTPSVFKVLNGFFLLIVIKTFTWWISWWILIKGAANYVLHQAIVHIHWGSASIHLGKSFTPTPSCAKKY